MEWGRRGRRGGGWRGGEEGRGGGRRGEEGEERRRKERRDRRGEEMERGRRGEVLESPSLPLSSQSRSGSPAAGCYHGPETRRHPQHSKLLILDLQTVGRFQQAEKHSCSDFVVAMVTECSGDARVTAGGRKKGDR